MKSVVSYKYAVLVTALFLSVLTCYGQKEQSDLLAGTWTKTIFETTVTFTLTSDLKYQVDFVAGEEAEVWGSYSISGTRITVNDEGGEYSADMPGEYEFQVNDTALIFTGVNDPVEGRRSLMVGTWIKDKSND